MTFSPQFGSFKLFNLEQPVLLPKRTARLSLNGRWKLGGARNTLSESARIRGIVFNINALLNAEFLRQRNSLFNAGAWNILSNNPIDTWTLNGTRKIAEKRISAINTTARSASALLSRPETIPADFPDEYYTPAQPIKLGVFARKLDSSWKLGAFAKLNTINPGKLNGAWKLGNRKMTYSARIGSFKILPLSNSKWVMLHSEQPMRHDCSFIL